MARVALRIFVVLLLLLLVAGAVLWRLTYAAPSWYRPPDPRDVQVSALAERVEYRLVEEAQKIRDTSADAWALRVKDEHVNAWLAARLPKWLAHHEVEWPDGVGTLQVRLEPGAITVAAPLRRGPVARTLVITLKPELGEQGLRLRLASLAVGRIAVAGEPLDALVEYLGDSAPDAMARDDVQAAIAVLSGERAIDPIIELSDGRTVRLVKLQIHDGAADLTAVTLP